MWPQGRKSTHRAQTASRRSRGTTTSHRPRPSTYGRRRSLKRRFKRCSPNTRSRMPAQRQAVHGRSSSRCSALRASRLLFSEPLEPISASRAEIESVASHGRAQLAALRTPVQTRANYTDADAHADTDRDVPPLGQPLRKAREHIPGHADDDASGNSDHDEQAERKNPARRASLVGVAESLLNNSLRLRAFDLDAVDNDPSCHATNFKRPPSPSRTRTRSG